MLPSSALRSANRTLTLPLRIHRSLVSMAVTTRDPTTLSNYGHWRTRHVTASLRIDFDAQRLGGNVELELVSQTDRESSEIVLDSSFLDISAVRLGGAADTKWELKDRVEPYGAPLHVAVPGGAAKNATVKLSIDLSTTRECTALQWLTPAQTSTCRHPFMFSQCQAIHARSLFPCQDTPDVKASISFIITSRLPVVASGILKGKKEKEKEQEHGGGEAVYRFEQEVPIPAYLFALAAGDIATARIGKRSLVATSPDKVDAAKWEFEADMEKYLAVAEKLIFEYQWGEYNIFVLPPSFPYGGMENPVYTFATPTLVSGDRENVSVIAHELSHSWSGNLVTNASWEHFYLNEGWTTYLERRLCAEVHGAAEFDFSAILGWKALSDAVSQFGKDHEFTKLIVNHGGINPDDVFSTIPYEKGFHFIYFLDRTIGRTNFDKFIPHYFKQWSRKSLDSFEFKQTFLDFCSGLEADDKTIKEKVSKIDWDSWFYAPGLPPKPNLDTSLVDACYALADKWENDDFTPSPDDVASLTSNQKLVFLERVEGFEKPLGAERARLLGATYKLLAGQNIELKTAYYIIALRARDTTAYAGVTELLGQVGRMKFVRPLYRILREVDLELARRTFREHETFYHPICRSMVAKDLGV